jgi:hypothetical protein
MVRFIPPSGRPADIDIRYDTAGGRCLETSIIRGRARNRSKIAAVQEASGEEIEQLDRVVRAAPDALTNTLDARLIRRISTGRANAHRVKIHVDLTHAVQFRARTGLVGRRTGQNFSFVALAHGVRVAHVRHYRLDHPQLKSFGPKSPGKSFPSRAYFVFPRIGPALPYLSG